MSSAPLPRRLKLAKALGRQNSRTRWLEVNRPPAGGDDQVPELLYKDTAGHDVLQVGSISDAYPGGPTEEASLIIRSDGWLGFINGVNYGDLVPESAVVRGPPAYYGAMLGPGPDPHPGLSITTDPHYADPAMLWIYDAGVDPQTGEVNHVGLNPDDLAGLIWSWSYSQFFPFMWEAIQLSDWNGDSQGNITLELKSSGFHTSNGGMSINGDDAGEIAFYVEWSGAGAPVTGGIHSHYADFFAVWMDGHFESGLGFGVWGVSAPSSQPATPVTLGDVIAVLQAYGMCA